MFLDLIFFAITFLSSILPKCVRDEKYSGTSPPTPPNGSDILLQVPLCLDALFEYFKQSAKKQSPRCQSKMYTAPP